MMIKVHINTVLLFLLSITMIVIAVVLVRISIQLNHDKAQSQQNALFDFLKFQQTNHSNSSQPVVQSDFFRKSISHAENVIKGLIGADEYAKDDKQGSDIIRKFMYLNDDERKSLLNAINYYQSDPMIYAESEREFRKVSQQKMIPLWIAILDDAMNKSGQKDNPSNVLRVVTS